MAQISCQAQEIGCKLKGCQQGSFYFQCDFTKSIDENQSFPRNEKYN
jgi:hypothetical protein